MSDFIKNLTRKNSLRKQCQELSLLEIEKVLGDLNEIYTERKEEEAKREAEEKARVEKIEQIRLAMKEAGIDLNDLADLVESTPRKSVKAKYVITDDEGKVHEWSGRGRTPVIFQEYMDAKGISKENLPTVD
ncbi:MULTISPECIES: H-NS histone family protein [Nitrincola]|uniref:DNA-binding protein n=1 Tax=Nitrincola nitratireducens TaxID=1229521 RepID=W9VMA7_9GAMM|nr:MULTISPECIES: H-NS histone family protein [Nitrincola]EXJ11650.1 Pathogenesis protein kcpA [Nitrincola nitratireducens]